MEIASKVSALTDSAVIYLRVSTREQAERDGDPEGYSLPAQREACIRKAQALGASVVAEFVDRGESAKTADRPELQRLLGFVGDQPVKYVIVHKVDRLARNRADDVTINLALQQAGVRLVSVTENIDDTPSGILLHGIMSSIAEFYSRNLANEVMKGTIKKAQLGGTPSRAPLGYRNVRLMVNGSEVRTVEVDPERAPLIAWAFEAYASGEWTMRGLLEELTEQGLRTLPGPRSTAKLLSPSQLHRILHHPYYTGVVRYQGVVYPGKHQALVSQETWQQVQDVLVAKNLSGEKQREHRHYLKGTVYCGGCGSRLIVNYATGRRGAVYPYFVCIGRHQKRTDCKQRAVRIEAVEELIVALYDRVQLSEEEASGLEAFVVGELNAKRALAERERTVQERHLRKLRDEQKKLLDAHYADAIPLDLLKSEQARIGSEVAIAERRLNAADEEFGAVEVNLRQALAVAGDCGATYRQAPDSLRRMFNQVFFRRILVDDEGNVTSELAEPFELLISEELRQAVVSAEGTSLADQVERALRERGTGPVNDRNRLQLVPAARERSVQTATSPFFGEGCNYGYLVGTEGLEPSLEAF